MDKKFLEELFERRKAEFYSTWCELLRFPTISADPRHDDDCARCAEWLRGQLLRMGLEAEVLPTRGKPVVKAVFSGPPASPRVLFYGHYDVQPVDPLEQWLSDPFEPVWRGERLYARGAQDNKGQLSAFLNALEVLLAHDALRCSLTILLEGEEETGSSGLAEALPAWCGGLRSDALLVCDTFQASPEVPAVIMGLRGVLGLEVELGGILRDLHSGFHGGLVKNPAIELARLLATLHNPDGSVAVAGFYEGVEEPEPELVEAVNRSPFDEEAYVREVGVPPLGGELRFSAKMRGGLRPCLDANGMHSGYTGPGMKTIIPSKACAKLSARLVGAQQPRRGMDAIVRHLEERAPAGLRLTVRRVEEGSAAVRCPQGARYVRCASRVLREIFDGDAVQEWQGGSIPIVADLLRCTQAEPVLVGFGLGEDNVHAPNESFSSTQYRRAFLYAALMLEKLSE